MDKQETEEYVNIINDAFEMNYGIVILRVAADFVISEDVDDGDVDGDEADTEWVGEDNEDYDKNLNSSEGGGVRQEFGRFRCETVSDIDYSEGMQAQGTDKDKNSDNSSPHEAERSITSSSLKNARTGSKISFGTVENKSNSFQVGDDADKEGGVEEKNKNTEREPVRSSGKKLKNIFLHRTPVKNESDKEDRSEQSLVTDSTEVVIQLEPPSSPSSESSRSCPEKQAKRSQSNGSLNLENNERNKADEIKLDGIQDNKQNQVQGEDEPGDADETTMLFEDSQPPLPKPATLTFTEKVTGHIDVWWLFDDGGLTVLIPYLLAQSRYWKGCKLRIISPDSTRHIKTNQLKMASLLKKFRIEFSSIVEVRGINRRPSEKSIKNFLKLPFMEEFKRENLDKKTLRHIRIGELLREKSLDAQLIVISLPVPRLDVTSPSLYMSWLEVLTANLPPVLLVRGNQGNVLTFYS